MDYQAYACMDNAMVLYGVGNFNLADILECGQCFRWIKTGEHAYTGTVHGLTRTLEQSGDTLRLIGADEEEFFSIWQTYLDFDRDYDAVKHMLTADPIMRKAVTFTPGMRVLRQPPWETLCSFIVSANNNILRIRGIMDRLCRLYGAQTEDTFAFPTPERLACLAPDDLAPIRAGYRAPYLIDAAQQVASGQIDLTAPYTLPLDQARKLLQQIKGVGPKVAECVLLYGYARSECVPVDVWIGRALDALYPDGLPPALTPVAGLGQQYLFHYVRNCPDALPSDLIAKPSKSK